MVAAAPPARMTPPAPPASAAAPLALRSATLCRAAPRARRCHDAEHAAWHGSDHDLAMQVANDASVLGDFNDAKFTYAGTTSTFSQRDGKFIVNTDGPDGQLHDYEIGYTFGVRPLQQYLIDFPGGRKQALSIAWDSRPKEQGGQRWFHLYPNDNVKAGDWLHWTNYSQNWNFTCAECHSTDLKKNYDPAIGHVQDDVGRNQRIVRGVPRPRLQPRRLGAQGRRLAAVRCRQGTGHCTRRTQRRHMDAGRRNRQRATQRAATDHARDRHVRALSCARAAA